MPELIFFDNPSINPSILIIPLLSIYELDFEQNNFFQDIKRIRLFSILIQIVFGSHFNTICFYFIYFFKPEFTS